MIFDKEYDASLWYIVKANRRMGKKIVEFLRGIPTEAIIAIRNEIELQKGNKVFEVPKCHKFMSKTEPNVYYRFDVDGFDMCLTITKSIDDGKMNPDLFEIMLFPTDLELLDQMEYSDEQFLGMIYNLVDFKDVYDDEQIGCGIETNYVLHHFPIGYFVSHTKEILNGERELVLFRPVSTKRVPEDLTTNNILKRRLM